MQRYPFSNKQETIYRQSTSSSAKALSEISYEGIYSNCGRGRGFDEEIVEWLEIARRKSTGDLSLFQRKQEEEPSRYSLNRKTTSTYFSSLLFNSNSRPATEEIEVLQEPKTNKNQNNQRNPFSYYNNFSAPNKHFPADSDTDAISRRSDSVSDLYNQFNLLIANGIEKTNPSVGQESYGSTTMTSTLHTPSIFPLEVPRTTSSSDNSINSYSILVPQPTSESILTKEPHTNTIKMKNPLEFSLAQNENVNPGLTMENDGKVAADSLSNFIFEKSEDLMKWLEEQPYTANSEEQSCQNSKGTNEVQQSEDKELNKFKLNSLPINKRRKTESDSHSHSSLHSPPTITSLPNYGQTGQSLWDDCLLFELDPSEFTL